MDRDSAVVDLDHALEHLVTCLANAAWQHQQSPGGVPVDEIGHLILDEPLGTAADSASEVFDGLVASADEDEADVEQLLRDANLMADNAFMELDQALWEMLEREFESNPGVSRERLVELVQEVVLAHRGALMDALDILPAWSPPSSPEADEEGVILPIDRRRI